MRNLINKITIIGFSIFSLITFACSSSDEVPYTLAKNYFVKNNYPDRNLHMLKITNDEKFNSVFGTAPVMGEKGKPTEIDFSKNFVIALIDDTSTISAGVSVKSLVMENGTLRLTYDLERKNNPDTAYFRHFTILIVDKKYESPVYANIAPQNGYPLTGGDLDDSGCKPSTGYSWSILENDCIQPWDTKYVFEGEINNAPLIFSKDHNQAEIMRNAKFPDNLILTKKLKSKLNTWAKGDLMLIQIKKDSFVLKEKNRAIGIGKPRK
ncbi:hypothetical protein [Chryseobacterium koreense]|uniref:hypothetical protein n=1 Tax=Chryseobacterium koreense TaxID=232216 RepID=UPI00065AC689|nr:hypothetical protein [Chryseobacterium koreense]MBB5334452.1 hypothetical protein [Chryseobacterium koreense]